jgi:hypothetical protein
MNTSTVTVTELSYSTVDTVEVESDALKVKNDNGSLQTHRNVRYPLNSGNGHERLFSPYCNKKRIIQYEAASRAEIFIVVQYVN